MRKILTLILCLGLFAGCSESVEKKTTVCTYTEDGLTITNTIVSEEDAILTQTLKNEFDYVKAGHTKETIEMLTNTYKDAYTKANIDYTATISGNMLIEESIVDFQKANLLQLIQLGLIQVDRSTQYISLEKTVESLKEQKFTCK